MHVKWKELHEDTKESNMMYAIANWDLWDRVNVHKRLWMTNFSIIIIIVLSLDVCSYWNGKGNEEKGDIDTYALSNTSRNMNPWNERAENWKSRTMTVLLATADCGGIWWLRKKNVINRLPLKCLEYIFFLFFRLL